MLAAVILLLISIMLSWHLSFNSSFVSGGVLGRLMSELWWKRVGDLTFNVHMSSIKKHTWLSGRYAGSYIKVQMLNLPKTQTQVRLEMHFRCRFKSRTKFERTDKVTKKKNAERLKVTKTGQRAKPPSWKCQLKTCFPAEGYVLNILYITK